MKALAGELYLSGHQIDFLEVNNTQFDGDKNNAAVINDLPHYHWSYTQLLWNEPRSSIDLRNRKYVRHELLGSETAAANGIERCWRNIFKPSEVPWIDDHRVSKAYSLQPQQLLLTKTPFSWKIRLFSLQRVILQWRWKRFHKSNCGILIRISNLHSPSVM